MLACAGFWRCGDVGFVFDNGIERLAGWPGEVESGEKLALDLVFDVEGVVWLVGHHAVNQTAENGPSS